MCAGGIFRIIGEKKWEVRSGKWEVAISIQQKAFWIAAEHHAAMTIGPRHACMFEAGVQDRWGEM